MLTMLTWIIYSMMRTTEQNCRTQITVALRKTFQLRI